MNGLLYAGEESTILHHFPAPVQTGEAHVRLNCAYLMILGADEGYLEWVSTTKGKDQVSETEFRMWAWVLDTEGSGIPKDYEQRLESVWQQIWDERYRDSARKEFFREVDAEPSVDRDGLPAVDWLTPKEMLELPSEGRYGPNFFDIYRNTTSELLRLNSAYRMIQGADRRYLDYLASEDRGQEVSAPERQIWRWVIEHGGGILPNEYLHDLKKLRDRAEGESNTK